jgi:hypothetical protein
MISELKVTCADREEESKALKAVVFKNLQLNQTIRKKLDAYTDALKIGMSAIDKSIDKFAQKDVCTESDLLELKHLVSYCACALDKLEKVQEMVGLQQDENQSITPPSI